ncbi:MAG: hypothetical protein R3310_16175 [Candidatus Competibacteraceae bacterium]|nr:hypothetical protein [Candidatus Competibacteraceae bacterium]
MSRTASPGQDQRLFVYCIDDEDQIAFVNQAWLEFARENAASSLVAEAVLGRRLWHFIADPQVVHLYRGMLERVRGQGGELQLPFRCDSPHWRRFMQLHIHRQGQWVCFESRILRQEHRAPVALLEADKAREREWLRICSWCKKVQVEGRGWMEVERAVAALKLFDSATLPQLTHGMCPLCYRHFIRQLPGRDGCPTSCP